MSSGDSWCCPPVHIFSYQDRKVLIVDLHVREPLDRKDLNEFKDKVQRNFDEDLLIRTRITFIP